jgi:AcrR family transcriptional regulator
MDEPVKPARRYDSPRRREQAAATRRDILAAAARRFEQDGYVATTMAAIAREAGVALKTVYLAFETKSNLLRQLWHLLLRGDEQHTPVGARAWYQAVLDEPDPARQLRLNARNARVVKERAGSLLAVIRGAAATDADTAALWSRIQQEFYENQRAIVATLAARGALAAGLDVTRATDILWTLNHPDVWLLLVHERGWTPEQFEQWFGDASCAQLLAAAPDARAAPAGAARARAT